MASTEPRNRLSHAKRYALGYFWNDGRYDDDSQRRRPNPPVLPVDYSRRPRTCRRRIWTQARLANGEPARWGYGWQVERVEGRTIVSHGGGTAGFSCWYRRDVSRPLSTIMLTNQNGRADPKTMTDALLRVMETTG